MPPIKPNFNQIAERAGVSPSTVDRVLNDRGGVSEARRKKVLEAARMLGTARVLPSAVRGSMHFDIIRTKAETDFSRRLDAALQKFGAMLGKSISIHRSIWADEDQTTLSRFIIRPRHRRHGLIMFTGDTPVIREALEVAVGNGMPAVLVVNNLTGLRVPVPYVGVDNHAAGATAALLMGRFQQRPGRVLLLAGSPHYLPYRQRSEGFKQAIARDFSHLEVVGPIDMRDDDDHAEAAVRSRLMGPTPVVGLYSLGMGTAGIERALDRLSRERRPAWITHESTPLHEALLQKGRIAALIEQDAEAQAFYALQHLLYANHDAPEPDFPQTRFHVITAANPWLLPAPTP
ncbi:MAG: LacI family DNA-binding transcriptional regulator [Pseudoxanthomonas sp.]